LVVNHNNVEAGWVELERESQLLKSGWMSFQQNRTFTDCISMDYSQTTIHFP
jgi:hypothetical protein